MNYNEECTVKRPLTREAMRMKRWSNCEETRLNEWSRARARKRWRPHWGSIGEPSTDGCRRTTTVENRRWPPGGYRRTGEAGCQADGPAVADDSRQDSAAIQ